MTELSRNMLLQTSPDLEALVRSDFAAILAEAIDKAAIVGGGVNEPTGAFFRLPGLEMLPLEAMAVR